MQTELVSTPTHGKNDIHTPRRPLVATACSTVIAALVAFFEDPRVCLGGAVVAESVIIMGQGKNEETLKEETRVQRIDASLSTHVQSGIRIKIICLFQTSPEALSPLGAQRSSLRCASGVKCSRPTNRVGHLNEHWEESLACGENLRKTYEHRKMFSALRGDQGGIIWSIHRVTPREKDLVSFAYT